MVSITSEYGLYLYIGRVDMRKGIDGLRGIISEQMGHNPRKAKSVYVFSGRNPRVKKVLIREYNRYELTKLEGPLPEGVKKRSACLIHIRHLFVNALKENFDEAMWFIDRMGLIFAKEHCFKEQTLTNDERYLSRLKPGSTADLMRSIEERLASSAFMCSLIESCRLNDIDPGKYISCLLGKLKTAREGDDLTGLLPCYCGL